MATPTSSKALRGAGSRVLSPHPSLFENDRLPSFDHDSVSEADTDANTNSQIDGYPDSDDTMPKPRVLPTKRDADISLILTPQQRGELTRLVEGIHAKMEEIVAKPTNFLKHPVAQANRVVIWNYAPVVAAQTPRAADTDTATTSSSAGDKQADQSESSNIDGDAAPRLIPKIDVNSVQGAPSSMNVLRDENTQYFNKWKVMCNKRFNDLIVPNLSNSYAGSSRQGQGALRGGGAAGGGPSGRFQQSQPQQQQVNKGIPYQADLSMIRRFPPTETSLCHLPVDKRRLLIHATILMLMSNEHYISYNRIFLLHFASSLHIPSWVLIEEENRIAQGLGKIYRTLCEEAEARELEEKLQQLELEEAKKAEESPADTVTQPDNKENEKADVPQEVQQAQETKPVQEAKQVREPKKKWRPSANPVQVGNTLLGAGIGMIHAAQGLPAISLPPATVANLLGPLGDCDTAVGVFFGVNPSRTSIKSLESLCQNFQDGAFIPLHGATKSEICDSRDVDAENRRMRIVLCCNGSLTSKDDIIAPWECLGHHNEVMTIRWETESLEKLGGAFEILIRSKAWEQSLGQLTSLPVMDTMRMQAWPDALMRVSKIVDNAWILAYTRSSKLQMVLQDTIVGHVLGERGISLIGHGLGARAIFMCLAHLAERKMYGLVDNVVLMGAPVPSDAGTWSCVKSTVTGRLVNVYSPTDYMLAFASRQGAYQFGVAGLSQVQGVGGVENHDVSDILDAHLQYPSLVPAILKRIAWEDLKQELKAPPPQPIATNTVFTQKAPTTANKSQGQSPAQMEAKAGLSENKENALPQRGGRGGRGSVGRGGIGRGGIGRGGGRGGRGGRGGYGNNTTDKNIADHMGTMGLK